MCLRGNGKKTYADTQAGFHKNSSSYKTGMFQDKALVQPFHVISG